MNKNSFYDFIIAYDPSLKDSPQVKAICKDLQLEQESTLEMFPMLVYLGRTPPKKNLPIIITENGKKFTICEDENK